MSSVPALACGTVAQNFFLFQFAATRTWSSAQSSHTYHPMPDRSIQGADGTPKTKRAHGKGPTSRLQGESLFDWLTWDEQALRRRGCEPGRDLRQPTAWTDITRPENPHGRSFLFILFRSFLRLSHKKLSFLRVKVIRFFALVFSTSSRSFTQNTRYSKITHCHTFFYNTVVD